MSSAVFKVFDKNTNTTRLIKADTKGQVKKFLVDGFEISKAGALDVMEAMQAGAPVLDASNVIADAADGGEGGDAGDAGSGGNESGGSPT